MHFEPFIWPCPDCGGAAIWRWRRPEPPPPPVWGDVHPDDEDERGATVYSIECKPCDERDRRAVR